MKENHIQSDHMNNTINVTNNELPNFLSSVRLKYVKLGYHYLISNAFYILLLPVLFAAASSFNLSDLTFLFTHLLDSHFLSFTLFGALLIFLTTLYFTTRPRKVFLLDFSCYKPDSSLICTRETFMDRAQRAGIFTEEALVFQQKILERSGIGQKTYIPEALLRVPPNPCMSEARKEAEMVMFGAIDAVLEKTGVKPKDIGILVVNCSLFTPTPSLSAMIVNKYKLRGNILSYNLGGMGCSAGLISIDLAKQLLQVQPNLYALVVSTEIITLNTYLGSERSMLLSNCLFRMGGAAVLLSNRSSDRRRSKYQLIHTVRTHNGADDNAFSCAYQREDNNKIIGAYLSKDLMAIAGEVLKTNITTLGPLVLPMSEQILYFATLVAREVFKVKKIKPYIPDFKLAFEHFCIHAGGRALLDEIEKNLDLSEWDMEPSRMTLNRFGNTSSSSLWYELAYSEAKGRIKRGDRTWQIALGAGFKCNSAVWRALRTINPAAQDKTTNPWIDEIHEFPVPM
ncbi:PREDICTED: 3-ketoacyl-CoA synthase 2-like isoform X3 [Camelina sativa]|uniref:3-ketoacyl-CoA synthase n=1 Tax=Camelina sativa TaxID=90675 RepID=A0ABM0VK75_CAMSA|nr:PREDICTED: 3-ketoacyl-CoA synthase 2-like isoform X1 [Camelina sativa]XP_010457461.1 PREDICTED: 3-ketoacyl-CoA synthase 2-like isoform X2 [Camelina sativa]XP_019091656.1 PREDICTED: 3-ketoacyl-CoA synthase 2-like isoform X3 [Camelina sativa]